MKISHGGDLRKNTLLMSQRTDSSKSTVSSASYQPSEINPLEKIDSDIDIPDNANNLHLSVSNNIESILASEELPRDKKIQILTLLPEQWTFKTIADNFDQSWRIIKIAKTVLAEKGVLETPDLKRGTCSGKLSADLRGYKTYLEYK